MSLLAAESARLAQVQHELQQARESEAMGTRAAVSSNTAMPPRIEVSIRIGGGHQFRVMHSGTFQRATTRRCTNPAANIDYLFVTQLG